MALSALMGINGKILFILQWCSHRFGEILVILNFIFPIAATIFAYGQTSSGKTYTMRGITEKAVNDIYTHIMNVSFFYYLVLDFSVEYHFSSLKKSET